MSLPEPALRRIEALVAAAPPLTNGQKSQLAAIFQQRAEMTNGRTCPDPAAPSQDLPAANRKS